MNELHPARRVLVVEDDRDLADSLLELLEAQGLSVRLASSAAEALAALSSFVADIALVDIRLGIDDGVELLIKLREQSPQTVCVMMTAYATVESASNALRAGAHDYLTKPLQPKVLTDKIDKALNERDTRARAQREQRLALLGDLCARLAHDVNNVLQVMVLDVEAIEAAAAQSPIDAGLIRAASPDLRNAIYTAGDICRGILAFAKGTPALEGCDATRAVKDSEATLRRALPSHITLDLAVAGVSTPVALDAIQVGQIVLNLVLNSRHAIGQKGAIRVEVLSPSAASTVHISVSDDGAGIDDAVLPRIFEPYFSTKPASEGSGLGLAIVYGMVKAAGGDVHVVSQVGVGTRFEIVLPRRTATEATADEQRAKGSGSKRVLLVENSSVLLESMCRLLERAGYRVLSASSGEEALNQMRTAPAAVECLISDVDLPGMSGLSLAHELREQWPNTSVILVSGGIGFTHETAALGPGVAVLPKPFDPAALLATLAKITTA
jgi:DNA-binding response OmpR family regulator/anti-sigma regulatory factor (Ser/Thr protein kinase)